MVISPALVKRQRSRFQLLKISTYSSMEEEEEIKKQEDHLDYYYNYSINLLPIFIPNTISVLFTELFCIQVEFLYNCLVTAVLTPLFSLMSLVSDSFHMQAQQTKESLQSAVETATRVPCSVAHGIISGILVLVRKIGMGFVGAVYVWIVLTIVMALAIVMGVGLVNSWVEEPVFVRDKLLFDYTVVNPTALYPFSGGGYYWKQQQQQKKKMGVPVGHTFSVSVVLLFPESDFNIQIGVFQVAAELISTNGDAIAKSSQPCMLRFRSLPIRLLRTFLMGIPLLLGITEETQKITIPLLLNHKELGYPRSEAVRVSLIPRAGTISTCSFFIPQLYEAEIVINSKLPWTKEIVRNWKWTFYVWASLYIYILLLIIVCCFKPQLIFPAALATSLLIAAGPPSTEQEEYSTLEVVSSKEEPQERSASVRDEIREISESLRRWRQSRSTRRAMLLLHGVSTHTVAAGSSASSFSITTREDLTIAATEEEEEDAGDSELVCFGS